MTDEVKSIIRFVQEHCEPARRTNATRSTGSGRYTLNMMVDIFLGKYRSWGSGTTRVAHKSLKVRRAVQDQGHSQESYFAKLFFPGASRWEMIQNK